MLSGSPFLRVRWQVFQKRRQMAKTALERTIDFVGENNESRNSLIRFVELIGDL
jgi:hypothetical protein